VTFERTCFVRNFWKKCEIPQLHSVFYMLVLFTPFSIMYLFSDSFKNTVINCVSFDHTLCICIILTVFVVIQSCSVDPIPEKDVISKFDGKNVLESIVRYANTY
jgi:hypothetical protein